jgi:hypothetical protein
MTGQMNALVTRMSSGIVVVAALCIVAATSGPAYSEGLSDATETTPPPGATSRAASQPDSLAPATQPEYEPPLVDQHDPVPTGVRVRAGSHDFVTSRMDEAYDPIFFGSVEGLTVATGFGIGFELGWFSGKGTPPLTESDWDVTDSSVSLWSFLFEINLYYNLLDDKGRQPFMPYVGIGPALWFGGETLAARATRSEAGLVEGFDAEQLALGVSFGLSAMAGTTIRIKDKLKMVVEGRYVLSTSGSMADMADDEDKAFLDETLYSAVERPGFNFTGWQVTIGIQF